jgi:hypothetical protein
MPIFVLRNTRTFPDRKGSLSFEYGGAIYCDSFDSLNKIRGQESYEYKIKNLHENHKKTIMALSDWICFDLLTI